MSVCCVLRASCGWRTHLALKVEEEDCRCHGCLISMGIGWLSIERGFERGHGSSCHECDKLEAWS